MEERDGHDIFGPYTPNNLTLTMDGCMRENQLGNPINLGEQDEEHHQPQQQYQNPASIPCWSPLKGKNREIIDSMSNSMAMPSTSSTNIGVSAYLNPLFSMRIPMSVGIEAEQEEENGTEQTDSSSSTETESESEEEKAANNDDSDYEPTNEEEEEAVVEQKNFKNISQQQQKNTSENIRPKFDKEKGSNVEVKSNKYKIGEDGIVRSKYANRKSQKGIPKDCGWERVDEQANNSNSGNDVQQQQVAGGRAVFRRTRGRWQSNQWKFVTEMRITENLEAEIKQKYGVYAYVKAKPTNMRCKRVLHGCTYKMLLRQNCEDIPDGFVHLYERNAHNHKHIEAPEGFTEAPLAKWARYKHKRFDDWLYIGRRWTLEQIMAHKKANGLRGNFFIQKREKRQYFTLQYLQCGFTSSDGQRCEYRIRSKQNYDVIDDDEPTFTVSERGKHNHENTLEDVEVEDDDDEVGMNDDENTLMNEEQFQQQQQSTSAATTLENNLEMQCQQQNYGLEEEEYQDLDQFNLATEPISAGNPAIVEVDLLMLIPKIAQSARTLKSALASKNKRNRKKGGNKNFGAADQEERRKSVIEEDEPLWEGKMMMRNLAKRMSENRANITNEGEGSNQQQQPSTSSAADFDHDCSQSTSANLHLVEQNLEEQQSNSSVQIAKPITKMTVAEADGAIVVNEQMKIKWRHVGQCSYTDFYKKISDEPWVLYGKNGWMYYYKCDREPTDHQTPCNFRIRLHSHLECNNHFVIYESGQHSCGIPAQGNSFTISKGTKENKNTISYRRNRVKLQHYRLGKMEKYKNKMTKVSWCSLPGKWTRERMYQRARDEHGLRLYAWTGIARLYFECEQVDSDGLQCEFKLRAIQIEKRAAEKSKDATTSENDDEMGESDNNIEQIEPQTTGEESSQFLYKLSETVVWHNHNTTVHPIGRAQYKLKNVDLSKWKFVKDVYNFYQYRDLRFQLGVPDSRQHFRSLKQATLNCVQKAARGPTKQQCPYCILLFRDFQHGPVHVYEKGVHKHSITDEDDGHDYDKNKLRKCGFMDSQPWMLIAENVTKEELIQYAEKHELDPMQKGLRLIYFKCNKFGPDDRICQFKICGRMINKNRQKQGGNNEGTQMEDDSNLAENPDEDAEELNDKNEEDAEEGNQPILYKLFETKYYHNHEYMAPISEKRYVGMNKNDVFDDANGQWNLKTTVYDWEDFQDLKRTENLPRYNFFNHQRILLVCSRRGCKYRLQIYRRFIGDPMKVYVQNEKHNHPPNKTIMAVRHENDDQIDDTGKIYRKNGMQRCLKKSRKIAKLRPTIIKSNKKNSTIFEQIIHSNLDGPQMSLEQFCQAYWSIELEEQQIKDLQESGEKNLQIEQNTRKSIQNQIEEMEEEQQENLEQCLEQLEEGTSQRLFINEKEMVTVQRVEFQREDSNEIREEMPEGGSIEDPGIMLLSSPMPITSSAPEIYPISADQQNKAIASELLIPILGQGPSAFKKPVTRYRRSTSLTNEAFSQFENNGDICQGPALSNSAPPQLSSIPNLEGSIDVNQSQIFPINSSTTFSEMPKINLIENVLNCQEFPRYYSPRILNCQELPRYSSPRMLNCQELPRYSSPRMLNCQELPRYSSPRILNCQELPRYSSPRILNCQELPRYSSPRILNCQELPRYSSPRILNCQEMLSLSVQIQESVEQQYSFPSSSSAIPSAESQQINNEFDVNATTQENYTEFLDFDESNQAAELSSNSIPKDQNEENIINFEINDGNNNCQKEGQNDNVFSRLASPLSLNNDFLQINDNDNEDENQIAVSQTMTSLLGAVDEATNATNELNETEQGENGEQTTSSDLFSPNHAEKWTKLSTDEKSRMDELYQKYLQKWQTNQHMKKVINRPKHQNSIQRSGKIKGMKKRKKRRPRGLFVKTRAAKQRLEKEMQRRREFMPTRRGAYLDDSSDEDGNNGNGNENNDNRIENVARQELDNAEAECNQNEDGNIGGEFEEEIGIGFLEDTNEEEILMQKQNAPSTSQKAVSLSEKRRRGRPSTGSKPSISQKVAKRGRLLRSTKKAVERQKTPKPQNGQRKRQPKIYATITKKKQIMMEKEGPAIMRKSKKKKNLLICDIILRIAVLIRKQTLPIHTIFLLLPPLIHRFHRRAQFLLNLTKTSSLIQMPTQFQLPSPIPPPATSSRINIPNPTVQPYYMQFPPIVAQMNAISQQTTKFRPDCLEDVGAEAVIGDEVEEIVATGELTEIKVEEEEGDRRNYKNRMERRNNCQLVPMTTIKTNCRHLPIAELHASSSKEIVHNSTQSAIEDLSQIQSTSNAPPIIELKSNLDSIGHVLMETSIPFTGNEVADDRPQLGTMPRMTQSTPKKKKQQKRSGNGQSNASPNAKRAKPNESGQNSKSNSTPAGKNRGRGRPPVSTKKQQNVADKTPAVMPNNNNDRNDSTPPPKPSFNLNDFAYEQLELLGAEWGLHLQKRGSHLLFFKPIPVATEEEIGAGNRKSRILRHTTMGLLLMDNGDHVQLDECELIASDGSYRPNAKPTDRWFKGKASGRKFLRCLHRKMAQCFGDMENTS